MANLGERISAACRDYADTVAIDSASLTLTYTQLLDSATALAVRLRERGAGAHEPVHVRVSNQAQDFAAFLGVWLAGCVVVPVHRTSPAAVTDRILAKSRARFIVDMDALRSGIDHVIEDGGTGAPAPRTQLEGAALIIFTSGSTGAPKGVVVMHHAFAGKLLAIDAMIHFRRSERTLLLLNITFSFGIWVGLLTLLGGGTVVLPEKFDPALLLAQLRGERICRVGVVPTMLRAMLSLVPTTQQNAEALACPALQQILTGGEQLSEQLAGQVERLFPNADLINIFGLTETSTCDFFQFPNYRRTRPLSLGLPSSHVEYRVVDETQTPVSAGMIGELQIRSPYLMRGYLDEPELTAAAFAGAWFRTGDLATQDADDHLQLMGRHKELIVRGGNKVTPMEIEQATMMFEGVGTAMAVGAPDPILGERIHVLIVPFAGSVIELAALRTFLGARLEKYKIPDFFYVGDALPIGRTGKADRRELRTLIEGGALAPLTSQP
jgi:long-chain acyl-CoA synthetase